jgi:hypothetical protein
VGILAAVAGIGAALSYASLYGAAADVFPPVLAAGFPLLVDALILGASLRYVAGARLGRPVPAWRVTAHAGIAGTIALNALAANTTAAVPWHVVAPAVWAVLVELSARDAIGDWRAEQTAVDRIPARLWVTAPVESARTWLHLARLSAAVGARRDAAVLGAARTALRLSARGRSGRRVRREVARWLRTGALDPAQVLAVTRSVDRQAPGEVLAGLADLVLDGAPPVVHTPEHELPRSPIRRALTAVPSTPNPHSTRVSATVDVPGELLAVARGIAERMEGVGERVNRDTLPAAVRAAGHPLSGPEARALWSAYRADRDTRREVSG